MRKTLEVLFLLLLQHSQQRFNRVFRRDVIRQMKEGTNERCRRHLSSPRNMEKYVKRPSRRVRRLEWKSSLAPAPWHASLAWPAVPCTHPPGAINAVSMISLWEELPACLRLRFTDGFFVLCRARGASFVSGTLASHSQICGPTVPTKCQVANARATDFSFSQDQREGHRQCLYSLDGLISILR